MKVFASGRVAHIIDCFPPQRGKDGDPARGPSLALRIGIVLVAVSIVVLLNLLFAD